MLHLNTATEFQSFVHANKNYLIVVDFYAQWCSPCKRIAPWLEKRASELGDQVVFAKVDVDVNHETTSTYGVTAMPTFLFIRDAKIVDSVKGASETNIDAKIKQHAPQRTLSSPVTAAAATTTTTPPA